MATPLMEGDFMLKSYHTMASLDAFAVSKGIARFQAIRTLYVQRN